MEIPHEERNIRNLEYRRQWRDKGYEFLPVIEAGNSAIAEYTGLPQLIEMLHAEGYLGSEA